MLIARLCGLIRKTASDKMQRMLKCHRMSWDFIQATSRSFLALPWRTHAQRLCKVESRVHGVADLQKKHQNRLKITLQVFDSHLLNCTLGQEVRLLVVGIIVILRWLHARLQMKMQSQWKVESFEGRQCRKRTVKNHRKANKHRKTSCKSQKL